MVHVADEHRGVAKKDPGNPCAPVKGNSLLPLKLRVTREELVSYSSEKLSISSDEVISLRSKFLEITDGDLLSYCTRLMVQSSRAVAGKSQDGKTKQEATEIQDAVRRIYALGQAVCSMKHASLKLATEHEFGAF